MNSKQKTFGFKRKTRKGGHVFRININIAEVLDNLEKNKEVMAIDIPCTDQGQINVVTGNSKNGSKWQGINYYSWAIQKQEDTNGKGAGSVQQQNGVQATA